MVSLFAGLTSQSIDVFIQDSSSTTGGGLAGLVYNTASLVAYYRKGATGSATAITLATQTVGGAYSSGGFVEIDATNLPGVYRLDVPNAMIDTAGLVTLMLKGAANMAPTVVRVDCRALPANTVQVNGTSQTAGDLTSLITTVDTVVDRIEVDTQDIQSRIPTALVGGRIDANTSAIAGSAVDTNSAQLGVNVVNWGGTATGSALVRSNIIQIAGNSAPQTLGVLSVNAVQISGDQTAADNCESFFDGTGYAGTNNVIPTVTTLTNLPAITSNWLTAAGLASDAVTEIQSGLATASALTTVGTNVSTLITTVGTAGAGLTAIPWNASWDAEVQSEVQDAIVVNGLDHLLAASVTGTDVTDGSVFARLASKSATPDWDSYNNTTDSLEALSDAGGGSLTVADIADGVWDELLSGHAISGSAGAALSAAQSAGDPWATALPGAYASGTAGNIIGNRLDAAVSSVETSVTIAPIAGNAPDRVEETTLKAFVGETWSQQVGGLDADGDVIDFTALGDLEFVLENNLGTDVVVIANASITKASTYFQVTIADTYVGTVPTTMKWALRQTSNNNVVLYGPFVVGYAANAD